MCALQEIAPMTSICTLKAQFIHVFSRCTSQNLIWPSTTCSWIKSGCENQSCENIPC